MLAQGDLDRGAIRKRVAEALDVVGLQPDAARLYPHEFSGGQRQRIAVARALAVRPKVVILDEPTSALDVSIRAQILNLLSDIQDEYGLSYLIIAHDLALVEHFSDVTGVMYLGNMVEQGPTASIFDTPSHPYTQALLASAPRPDPDHRLPTDVIIGEIGSALAVPSGCPFHPRCPKRFAPCDSETPNAGPPRPAPGHAAICFMARTRHPATPNCTSPKGPDHDPDHGFDGHPASEEDYLATVRAAQAANWPRDIPTDPVYPHGEVGITDYLRKWAETQPDKVFYNFYGGTITYGELDHLSDRFAARLAADGVAPGDRVAVFMGNCPQFAIAFFGILKAGAVHVPVNPMFREHELIYEMNDAGATVMVAADMLVPLVNSVRDRITLNTLYATGMADWVPETPAFHCPPSIVSDPSKAEGAEDFMAAIESCDAPVPQIPTDLDAVAALNYTGGTTGMPKGCVHTQRHMIYTAATTCGIGTRTGPGDMSVCFHPLFWIAGEDMGLLFPAFAGSTCILMGRWDAKTFMSAVDRMKPNQAGMLVDNAVEVMNHPEVGQYDLTSLEKTRVSSFVKTSTASTARAGRS